MLMGKKNLLGLVAFMLSGMSYYTINQNASGLSRTVNTLMWCVVSLLVLLIGLKVSADKYRFTPTALPFAIIGIPVLAISLSYADPAGVSRTGCRMAALMAGGGVFCLVAAAPVARSAPGPVAGVAAGGVRPGGAGLLPG